MSKTKTAGVMLSFGALAVSALSAFGSDLAVYRVPVPAQLQPYANFRIYDFAYSSQGGKMKLTYTLPLELTGVPEQQVQFVGQDFGQSRINLSGDQGDAQCVRAFRRMTCAMKMKNISTDPKSLESVLKSQSFSQSEFNSKLEVATRFSGEPIGVVTYFY